MNKLALRRIIADQKQLSTPRQFMPRDLLDELVTLSNSGQIIILSGIRRCGKSTLMQAIRQQMPFSDYYLNFDDERLIHFTVQDFQMLWELFLELYGEQPHVFFDEIQNIPGWERFIRRLHDYQVNIYLTGSNAAMLSRELGTHLTGRYIAKTLYPIAFKEYAQFSNTDLSQALAPDTRYKSKVKRLFHQYCKLGGFPDYMRSEQADYLKSLYESVLYRDIVTRHKLPSDKAMKELVFYVASNIGKMLSFNSIKKILGLGSATTVKEYFDYLESTYLVFLLHKYDHSLKRQTLAPKKAYFIDSALARQIGFRISADDGRLLENLVFLELKRRELECYYHHDKKECDFVIRSGYAVTQAIQVCHTLDKPETKQREVDGLLEALATYHLSSGLILTDDEQYEETHTLPSGRTVQVAVQPVWQWLLRK